jgi:hypothetical protein
MPLSARARRRRRRHHRCGDERPPEQPPQNGALGRREGTNPMFDWAPGEQIFGPLPQREGREGARKFMRSNENA